MTYDEVTVLIPSHSLEDFPTDPGEKDAAGLLNAFAVAWHPRLLAATRRLPGWHRADDPPDTFADRLFLVPTISDSWLPHGWLDRARGEGAVIIDGRHERAELLSAVLEPLESSADCDPELAADFLALGTCWLQLELLTRHMYHYTSLDELQLERHAVTAAEAALAGDAETARARLRDAFELLLESRERFYPVDCYLIDLCLLIPRLADDHLRRTLTAGTPLTLMATAEDLAEIGRDQPELLALLRDGWQAGTLDIAGGELRDAPLPLLPLESILWQFAQGHRVFRELFGRVPRTWARRRFGLSPLLPQLLLRFGYGSAMHLAMDDGLYPDAENSKIRWEGCDGSSLDAMTRIPLAADASASFVRFAQRMAESMQQDQVAAVVFARWPEVTAPWLDDFRRIHRYAPVLGRLVTLREFFEQTDDPGRLQKFEAGEYLTPFLIQAVARQEADPISRFARHTQRRHEFDAACWYRNTARVLCGQPVGDAVETELERRLEAGSAGVSPATDAAETAALPEAAALPEFTAESVHELARVVMTGGGDRPGVLLLNPLSFPRTVAVELPELQELPPIPAGEIKAVQFDGQRRAAVVEIPGHGFTWIPAGDPNTAPPRRSDVPLAEGTILRNEFFEVHINEATGGIGRIKGHGRSPNRLSQQLAFRFPRERTIDHGEEETDKTYYSAMRCRSRDVTSAGPALGEIVTAGEIVDQTDGTRLAGFRQTTRVWRHRPVVEIDIALETDRLPDGDPWSNFYAARFAWNDSTAALTRAVQQGAHGFAGERFESPHYLEIATEEHRTTIIPHGLPFWRKTGPRMVDSLLVVAGETGRRFRFTIAVDEPYPLQAALDAMVPVEQIGQPGPPRAGGTGWFFHLTARNIQLTRLLPLLPEPALETAANAQQEPSSLTHEGQTGLTPDLDAAEEPPPRPAPTGRGFAVRLVETEGRGRQAVLRCFRTPSRARHRDFQGHTITALRIEGDGVRIDLAPYEIADVELWFE